MFRYRLLDKIKDGRKIAGYYMEDFKQDEVRACELVFVQRVVRDNEVINANMSKAGVIYTVKDKK